MKTSSSRVVPATKGDIDRLEAVIRENTRDLIGHYQQGQTHQDDRMDVFDGRMDVFDGRMDAFDGKMDHLEKDITTIKQDIGLMKNAIVDLAENERHLRNLVRHLQREGIKITEAEVFAA